MIKRILARLAGSPPSSSGHPGFGRPNGSMLGLASGYTLVLVLLLFTSYSAFKTMEEVRRESYLTNSNYLLSSHLLDKIQGNIARAGISIRDLVSASESDAPANCMSDLLKEREAHDHQMKGYASLATLERQQADWLLLQQELTCFWESTDQILALHPRQPVGGIKDLMDDTVTRTRRVRQITERLAALNKKADDEDRQTLEKIYKSIRRRLVLQVIACLLLAFLIAVMACRYFMRLQQELFDQHSKVRENQEDLQKLSGHLVRVQEEERRAISREMHDQVGQSLTGVRIILSRVEKGLPNAPAELGAELREANDIVVQTIKEVRELSHILHPGMVDDLGLIPTLKSYIKRFAHYSGIDAKFKAVNVTERFSKELEASLYRIVQEALVNVSKHAQAKTVLVSLERRAAALELCISDDGRGFRATERSQGNHGLGLLGMRERIAHFGGELVVHSQPGCGTHLYVRVALTKTLLQRASAEPEGPTGDLRKLSAFPTSDFGQG